MSIRFKFRSSVNFDTVEIGDRGSITVGELRAKILKGKNSHQQQQGFDLVFSDAVSGLEFKGDGCHISSGSSVIVRRVPAGTLPLVVLPVQAAKNIGAKEFHNTNPANAPVGEFDDLGDDLCPVPDSNFPDFNLEFDNNDVMDNEKDQVTSLRLDRENHGPSDLSELIPKGCDKSGNEKNILHLSKADQLIKSNKLPTSNFLADQSTNLPVEMKCPLCNTFLKEAVMIPCCQHSFCQSCIRHVLIEKGRCPKCFSSKCNVENLLPNLTLRQAIQHCLEAQMLDAGLENVMQKYVPDGESGIHAKEFSCGLSVAQKDLELPQSSSATGKGSNRIEAFYEQHRQRNVPFDISGARDIKSAFLSQKVNQVGCGSGYPRHNDTGIGHGDLEPSADFQGENQPLIPPANVHYEGTAESNTKRQAGFWIDSGGGDRNFSVLGGHRKVTSVGVRNCYTCGSPDHLRRDCPMSPPNPMYPPGNGAFHGGMPGYGPLYWNGSSMPPPFSPYPNMYCNPAMMQFNTPMVPVSPFSANPYFPTMGSLGGNMRMGNMGPPRHLENFVQHCENKRKRSSEDLGRENISDEDEDDSPELYHQSSTEKLRDHRPSKDARQTPSRSDDSLGRRSWGKSYHDKASRSSHSGRDKRSNSGKEDVSRSSKKKHKHHHHGEPKKYHHDRKRKGHCDSELSYDHHSSHKDSKRRAEPDVKGSYKGYKERDLGKHDRWQAANDGLDEDGRDGYRYHKRKAR